MNIYKFLPILVVVVLITERVDTKSIKSNARPVHEIVNEQSRVDQEKLRLTPYGNPLSGNPQTARQHALHQQAMFNAERDRQHRAQLQRWTSAPQKMDSYMKAYHESQESHHLALENQQSKIKDVARDHRSNKLSAVTAAPQAKKIQRAEIPKRIKGDSTRITKADAIRNKQDKNRNHRSYGSDYYAHLAKYNSHPSRYYEGVTIKPNGNIGLSSAYAKNNDEQSSNLYTEVIPSKTQYVYPKQYSQMKEYQSAHDIASLSSLLQKPAQDQLSELNALIEASKPTQGADSSDIQKPIDLFFYLKDAPSSQTFAEPYEQTKYVELPQVYAQEYTNEHQAEVPRDHTPITEEVDDIADPNKLNKLTSYGIQPVLTPQAQILQEIEPETTTTKSNNYYKVEVASQTISSGYKPSHFTQVKQPIEYVLQHQAAESNDEYSPTHQTLHYGQQPQYYYKEESAESGDQTESYLHHDVQNKGVQHLTEDGTGVSAYGDDSHNLHYAANYEFGYRVRDQHSGNDFGHHEAKQGEKTNGHYHVLLPDGRMQKVKYWAGPSGYHADISYDHLQNHQQE